MDQVEDLLRELAPQVLAVLVRRYGDFDGAEDAVQEALVVAHTHWRDGVPEHPFGWLVTTASRRLLDQYRSEASRRDREVRAARAEPPSYDVLERDDSLAVLFMACHPALTPASAVALTLRAVGGLSTAEIARAFLVPEATMAQRISRAKQRIRQSSSGFALPNPEERQARLPAVLRVLYLIFNEGYAATGGADAQRPDLSAEAIRLARMVHRLLPEDTETACLLALMLLHHARRAARAAADGSLVPLAEQDRTRWDTGMIASGVAILQGALARDRLGEYQAQAAIAALHADAPTAAETDWVQIVEWYDELVRLTDNPVVRLNRAVAVGEADGPRAGLAALAELDDQLPRYTAVLAYLRERDGDVAAAARLYAEAARRAASNAERDHLTRQAARLNVAP